jgi:hypothetical protein
MRSFIATCLWVALYSDITNAFVYPQSSQRRVTHWGAQAGYSLAGGVIKSKQEETLLLHVSQTRLSPTRVAFAPSTLFATASESSDREPIRLIIAGAPASGKGTQCEKIKNRFDLVHLSTGDMLREAVAAGTAVGKKAKGTSKAKLLLG